MALGHGALMEREPELEALRRLLASAEAGMGGAVVVEGPPGIGKSTLLASARAAAGDLGVLAARGGEMEREFAFGIVRQLLEPVLASAESADRSALLAGAARLATPVLFSVDGDGGAEPPFSVLHGLYWLAANLAGRRPLLVVVDDVQWADLSSLRWLVYLARRLEGVPLAMVLATRRVEPGPVQDLLDEFVAAPEVGVVRPGELSEHAVAGLAAELLEAEAEPEFVAACHRATGGNPFLLRELFGEIERRGIAPSRQSAGLAGQLSSQGVGRAVRARLARLGPQCAALARAVAVLGDRVDPALAARLSAMDEREAWEIADRLADASILEPGRPLVFVHPLLRSSVYAELSAGERADWHARAAAVLTGIGAPADRVAVHLLDSVPRGDPSAVSVLRTAAAEATRRGAPEVAAAYLSRALREPPADGDTAEVVLELGMAELRAGRPAEATSHLTRAFGLVDGPARRAAVGLELGSALMFTRRAPDAVAVLSTSIDQLAGEQPELQAALAATRALAGFSSLDARRRLPRTADGPRATGGEGLATGARLALAEAAVQQMLTGTAAEARALALAALGDGELLAATGAHSPPLYLALNALLWSHALDDAERHLDAALRDARSRGSETGFALASQFRSALWWYRGALADVEADARAGLEHMGPFAFPVAAPYLAEALIERGDPDGAVSELRAVGLDESPAEPMLGVLALAARARIHSAQGRPAEALELLLACGRTEQAWEIVTPSLTNWRAEAALLAGRLGDEREAARLAADALQSAQRFGSPVSLGVARRVAALVAADGDTRELTESVDTLRASGARLELARSLVELGSALRRKGRRADARDPLEEGLRAAWSAGATGLAARAHDELVAAGARPRRDPIESRSELTAGELRVARLAAEGLTNREVAQALFVTENTIQTHLRSVFRKLDIRSRSQLARALA